MGILVSVIILATFVSGITNIMIEIHEVSKMYIQSNALTAALKRHRVSAELQHLVRNYVEAQKRGVGSRQEHLEIEACLQELPISMKRQVFVEMRGNYTLGNPVFNALQ